MAAAAVAAAAIPLCAAAAIGWLLDYSDDPGKADLIVVLDGEFSRPLYGADLYNAGYAPEIWVSRPYRPPGTILAVAAGASIPANETINREILIKRGVPSERIRLYGREVMSTLDEALALKASADLSGKKLLVVTSRTHARRSAWIFRGEFPRTQVSVIATPYESFTRKWWTQQSLARAGILETSKMLFYLFGGRFLSPLEHTPHK